MIDYRHRARAKQRCSPGRLQKPQFLRERSLKSGYRGRYSEFNKDRFENRRRARAQGEDGE
jgi:hypothetical protein